MEDIVGKGNVGDKYDYLYDNAIKAMDAEIKTFEKATGYPYSDMESLINSGLGGIDDFALEATQRVNVANKQAIRATALANIKPKRIGQTVSSLTDEDWTALVDDFDSILNTVNRKNLKTTKINQKWVDDVNTMLDDLSTEVTQSDVVGTIDKGRDFILSEGTYKAFQKIDKEFGTNFAKRDVFDIYRTAGETMKKRDIVKYMEGAKYTVNGQATENISHMFNKLRKEPEFLPMIKVTTSKGEQSFPSIQKAHEALLQGSQSDRAIATLIAEARQDKKFSKRSLLAIIKDKVAERGVEFNAVYPKSVKKIDKLEELARSGKTSEFYDMLRKDFPSVQIEGSSIDIAATGNKAAATRTRRRLTQELTDKQKTTYSGLIDKENTEALKKYDELKAAKSTKLKGKSKDKLVNDLTSRSESDAYLQANTGAQKALQKRKDKYEAFKKLTQEDRDAVFKWRPRKSYGRHGKTCKCVD